MFAVVIQYMVGLSDSSFCFVFCFEVMEGLVFVAAMGVRHAKAPLVMHLMVLIRDHEVTTAKQRKG